MEEELYWANKGVTEIMPVKKELMLCSLIEGAFNINGFQALEEFLSNEAEYPPQKCNKPFVNKLDKLAHKEMDKNQFTNVSLLLKALQRFCKEDMEDGLCCLIKHGLIQKMLLWFERATEFMKTTELKSSEALMTLIEDMFDAVLAICKCSSEGRTQLMDTFVLQLGHGVTDFRLKISVRLEAIRTFNSMLDLISREGKIKFHLSEEAKSLMLDLATTILEVGDYEIQVAISEALCRMTDRKTRETLVYKWFDEPNANAFKEIRDSEFETDCRKFLNSLNESRRNKRRVYTYPCNAAFLDLNELKIPADDKLERFWIDFNLGSRSITFFIKDDSQDNEVDLWETVSLLQDGVKSFGVQEVNATTILVIILKGLLSVGKKKGKKVKIYFDSTFDVLNTTKLVYGNEKLLDLVGSPIESQLKSTHLASNKLTVFGSQRSTVDKSEITYPASDGELARKLDSTQPEEERYYSDTGIQSSKSVKVNSKLKNLIALESSRSRRHSYSTTCSGRGSTRLGQQIKDVENDYVQSLGSKDEQSSVEAAVSLPSQPSSSKKIGPLDATELKPSIDAEDAGTVTADKEKNMTEFKRTRSKAIREKDVFDFETSSDSTVNLQVTEAKRRIPGRKRLSFDEDRNPKVATRSKKISRRGDMHRRSDLKKLFTEDSSSEGTEHSWILEPQVKVTPDVANYSKSKKRKTSRLRVLPLSLESSEDEQDQRKVTEKTQLQTQEENQKITPSGQIIPEFSDRHRTPVPVQIAKRIKTDDFAIGNNLVFETSLLTPPDTLEKMKLPSTKYLGRTSMSVEVPDNEEKTSDDMFTVQQSTSTPSERPVGDDSYLNKDEAILTPLLPFKAKRLFASSEKSDKGSQEMVQGIERTLSELDYEELSELNLSEIFQNFTEEMRKLKFCFRKMEERSKQSLQSAEQKISMLLNQIHKSRLQKLKIFEDRLDRELKDFKENVQAVKNLEEETLNFWKQQSLKILQFYENQEQRVNPLISSPEDKAGMSMETQADMIHMENEVELTSMKD
ncbi:synaptonemal complex protein 2-like isoform X3 [Chiloscyllium plagiosum]|uniref:synaptonemal complex protein 2-like isoform X3 n=1 Tax=Chiloscyllium plagiosum TaxID=36176 RepID=UPI001CB84DE6|nr:synaptonemal complex protein 2-like isoform X3 [Chiloscyllium plagiosum]